MDDHLETRPRLREFLDRKVEEYNSAGFIASDPIAVPHAYSLLQDIEIAAFFAAIFAWGNRTTILLKTRELMRLMDNAPHQFVRDHEASDLRRMLDFKHRTFNATDLLYFISFLQFHYKGHESLETAFLPAEGKADAGWQRSGIAEEKFIEHSLNSFHRYFFSLEEAPPRTQKHIAAPWKGSTCKRLNMFLRWMVRSDGKGVDFGIWKRISPAQLICPIDLHVGRVARRFGLITREQVDWQTALELTGNLRRLDPEDPVKYDFALFGLGVIEKF